LALGRRLPLAALLLLVIPDIEPTGARARVGRAASGHHAHGFASTLRAHRRLLLTLGASAFVIGLDSFAMNAPVILLTLVGGLLADRADRRRVIAFFQSLQMLCPVIIVALLIAGRVQIWIIIALSVIVGVLVSRPDANPYPNSTTAPAAMIEFLPTTALSMTIAPIPISTRSSIVHPWMIALCPIETSFPMTTFVF